jgi:hypothetical protein
VLSTAPTLPAGQYRGVVQVRICRDSPTTCASPVPGSPWSVPYDIVVTNQPMANPSPNPTLPPAPTSPPSPTPPTPSIVQFETAKLTVDGYAGEIAPQTVNASLRETTSAVHQQLILPQAHFRPNSALTIDGSAYTAKLVLVDTLAPGTYTGDVLIRLCRDRDCTAQVPGSPAVLPYEITVRPATNLTPLQRLAGVGEWAQHQADAKHTGFVPVTLDPTRFNRRWRWVLPSGSTAPSLQPVVTDNGTVFAQGTENRLLNRLYALSEHDRSERWVKDFGTVDVASPPATSSGRVLVATNGGRDDTFMWSFDGGTGTQQFSSQFFVESDLFYAPTIANGIVYPNNDPYQGLQTFDFLNGGWKWFADLRYSALSAPAVSGNRAFVMMEDGLRVLDASTGEAAFTINDPEHGSSVGAPMVDGAGNVIGIRGWGNRLVAFDVAARRVKWSVAGAVPNDFFYSPAVADGVVYAVNGAQLEARSQADGTRLWTWSPDEPTTDPFPRPTRSTAETVPNNIVVTRNMLFVSSGTRVYGIDLATRAVRWTYPEPGRLALSPNGILYVVTPLTRNSVPAVVAINLQ